MKSEVRRTFAVPDDRPIVLVTKGGGEEFAKEDLSGKGSRETQETLNAKLIDTVLEFAGTKSGLEYYFIVITGFGVTHAHAASTITTRNLTNVLLKQFTHEVLDFMVASDVVVSRAGANMIGEAVFTSRPQILIPVDVDDEQMANASYMASHSAAICLGTNTISVGAFSDALSSIVQDDRLSKQLVANARRLFPQIDSAVETAAVRVGTFAK
jgi:UDP-N-acetylglucosamine:LPS N-acetylglucosamine transferase